MGGVGDEEDVGDDIVVVCWDGVGFGILEGDGICFVSKDLLIVIVNDECFEDLWYIGFVFMEWFFFVKLLVFGFLIILLVSVS